MDELPQARWHVLEPAGRAQSYAATKELFGESLDVQYDLANADVVVSLDADFLNANAPGSVGMIRDFARGRKVADGDTSGMNRLYVVEPTPTTTGSNSMGAWRIGTSRPASTW